MQIDARTIFCDDIRREDNGKMLLIGVYADDLVPGVMPAVFPLSLWVTFKGEKIEKGSFSMVITVPSGENLKLEGEIGEVPVDASTSMIFNGVPIEIKQPGLITVQLFFGDNDPVDAGSLIVRSPDSSHEVAP